MLLHQTSFCFVCSHLTSGQKEGDEIRRNSDFMEIIKKTRFPRVQSMKEDKSPETILEHDRSIWLGDLNYRIALSYRSAKAFVEMQNWRALLEKDQVIDLLSVKPHEFIQYGLGCLEKLASHGDICAKEPRERLRNVVAGGDGTVGWVLGCLGELAGPTRFHRLQLSPLLQEMICPEVLVGVDRILLIRKQL